MHFLLINEHVPQPKSVSEVMADGWEIAESDYPNHQYGESATPRIVANGESATLRTYANGESIFEYKYPCEYEVKVKKVYF